MSLPFTVSGLHSLFSWLHYITKTLEPPARRQLFIIAGYMRTVTLGNAFVDWSTLTHVTAEIMNKQTYLFHSMLAEVFL